MAWKWPRNWPISAAAHLTLILLTWKIRWAPNSANRWQMVCNSAFKELSNINQYNEINRVHGGKWSFTIDVTQRNIQDTSVQRTLITRPTLYWVKIKSWKFDTAAKLRISVPEWSPSNLGCTTDYHGYFWWFASVTPDESRDSTQNSYIVVFFSIFLNSLLIQKFRATYLNSWQCCYRCIVIFEVTKCR